MVDSVKVTAHKERMRTTVNFRWVDRSDEEERAIDDVAEEVGATGVLVVLEPRDRGGESRHK